jgi:hypothetical protein
MKITLTSVPSLPALHLSEQVKEKIKAKEGISNDSLIKNQDPQIGRSFSRRNNMV